MTIDGDKVKVCGRNKTTGRVDPKKCRTAFFPPLVPAASKHIELELSSSSHTWISLHERKASVCRFNLRNRKVYCLLVPAPVPAEVEVKYVSLTDNVKFMRYAPKLGFRMSDINTNEVDAFDKALKQVTNKTQAILVANTQKLLDKGYSTNWCVKDDDDESSHNGCFEEAMPDPDERNDPPEEWWPDPQPEPYYREPEPEPIETAGGDGCISSPIARVCIRGERPPVIGPEERLPAGPTPWFPQGWCDTATMFCSKGQEPRDNDRGPGGSHRGKTLEELKVACYDIQEIELAVCEANLKTTKDYGVFLACKDRAWQRLLACVETAKEVTGNGAHPAP